MPQWSSRSLSVLIFVFVVFLIIFNIGVFLSGPTTLSIPLDPFDSGHRIRMKGLSLTNLPVFLESFPRSTNVSRIEVTCNGEALVAGRLFPLESNSYLGLFDLCDDVVIETSPRFTGIGTWLRVRRPRAVFVLFCSRYAFLGLVALCFFILFQNRKQFSSLRSVLIIQISILGMIDPFFVFADFFPSVYWLHLTIFTVFWWRCACELFVQYAPLLRLKPLFPKLFVFVPVLLFHLSKLTPGILMAGLGIVGSSIVPLYGAWFLVKAGNTTGKLTLGIHIVSGVFALTIAFVANFLFLFDDLQDEPVIRTLEVTVLGCFAIFQTFLHMGESTDESELHIGKRESHRYEQIEELLEALTHLDDDVKFEIPQG
jgi:hypothetical protein